MTHYRYHTMHHYYLNISILKKLNPIKIDTIYDASTDNDNEAQLTSLITLTPPQILTNQLQSCYTFGAMFNFFCYIELGFILNDPPKFSCFVRASLFSVFELLTEIRFSS